MHEISPLFGPVVGLVAWTLVMQIWMYVVRFGAFKRHGISLKGRIGGRPGMLDGVVEDPVQWKAHNYNHLMEQPTLFYAITIVLALMHGDYQINVILAWTYVGLRIVHSLIQATTNVVRWRFMVFSLASIVLLGLTIHAAAHIIHG